MPLWQSPHPLVLASKSEIRRALLEAAGIDVTVEPADIDERMVEAQSGAKDPSMVATLLAREKARAIAARKAEDSTLVLGADQTLALGNRRFSKASDRNAARAQLSELRGKTHTLHSGIAVARAGGEVVFEHCDIARLTMRDFSEAFLDRYMKVAGDAVLASVGGYQLEGLGIQLFEKIEGDHFTILGLPLFPLLDWFRARGILAK
jgi:septum formation protein